ncbi:hypothetical protein VCRA2122O339_120083 [Vibrio crassostreae]|nr:hypothetical protein VCRA2120E331_120083 [Vibrio crassostreae]CAK3175098.1 hypothetical protein VCRA2127O345_120083 [Vibrio crassostreae]CAK3200109.1 hypothetical protein VCRA2120E330_130078 [Vibrio crassostreae]CAK3210607.1 hypothetical protein VCRA2122O339_120083 [Vibrio crassostreae]CAK3212632.1 hypothetical protein VCRA2122O338_120083 [Vibrio crassostreae]
MISIYTLLVSNYPQNVLRFYEIFNSIHLKVWIHNYEIK